MDLTFRGTEYRKSEHRVVQEGKALPNIYAVNQEAEVRAMYLFVSKDVDKGLSGNASVLAARICNRYWSMLKFLEIICVQATDRFPP